MTTPTALTRSFDIFNRTLTAHHATRGVRVDNKAAESADLFIYDVIGEDFWTGGGVTPKGIAAALEEVKGVKTLNVFINSPGGSIFDGKAIYNQLVRFDAQKVVTVDGIAASAASFIAMAGDKIITAQGATWMIHNGIGGAYGFAKDLRAVADVLDLESENIVGIYAKRTKQSPADLHAWMDAETWMDAATAKARGFSDETAEDEAEKPAAAQAANGENRLAAAIEQTRKVAASLAAMTRDLKLRQCQRAASPRAGPASPAK